MKRILTLAVCLGLASTMAGHAEEKGKDEKKRRHPVAKATKQETKVAARPNRGKASNSAEARPAPQPRVTNAKPQVRNRTVARPLVNSRVNTAVRKQVVQTQIRNAVVTRRGPSGYSWSYDEARRFYHRGVRRDRNWYRSNYSRFALFAGGYYYFDRGYWYPAYGYDPGYTSYVYDEPIYGYNGLDPRHVIVNVQSELRRQGYYRGSIDGLIGPMTRSAVERYQSDRGLYVTRAIDGPTLAALGLT